MDTIKKIIVGLDFSSIDRHVISYAASISDSVQAESIYFLNIQKSLLIPDEIKPYVSHPEMPRDEYYKSELKTVVEKYFDPTNTSQVMYDVVEGSPTQEALRYIQIKDADLIILGRKKESKGSGVVSQQIVRKTHCSVLFVPEKPQFDTKCIYIPIDFSEYSKMCLHVAAEHMKSHPGTKLVLHHIFSMPLGYYSLTQPEEVVVAEVTSYKKEIINDFIKPYSFNASAIETVVTMDHRSTIAELIYDTAKQYQADMIVAGGRGRTTTSSLILGSVAEKLLKVCDDIPLFIVKKKEDPMGVMEALKTI